MKKLLILLTIAALVCLTFTAAAAGDGIAFEQSTDMINEGETLQTVLNREGDAINGEITYMSSNAKMATVDENGLVTAITKGRVVITAVVKAEKKSYKAQLKLNIARPVKAVTVNTTKLPVYDASDEKVAPYLTDRENAEENKLPVLLLPVNKRIAIAAAVEPKDATNRNITGKSSDETRFTFSKGNITGISPGEGILTIGSESNPDITTSYRVLVVQPVKRLTVESSAPTVVVGQQVIVSAHAEPENATMQNVIWSSGDERIITVDANGIITGVKRGNGRIIAIAADGSNVRANYTIKVVQNPESIVLNPTEISVAVGRNAVCKATVEPKNTDNKKVIWTSSDESIATVDKNGRINGKRIGDCTITCTSEALDSITSSITVHVVQPVKKVMFNAKNAYAYVGEGTQLTWMIEPSDATNQTLDFRSSKEAVAIVDTAGFVTGVNSGKSVITATTTDGSKRQGKITVLVGKHVTGVQMIRKHAYIDKGETATAGARIEPKDALNKNMFWESSNTNIVMASGNTNQKMKLSGVNYGDAVVTGTTEDGGFQTTINVTVGEFDKGIAFTDRVYYDTNAYFWLTVRNDTQFTITEITAELIMYDASEKGNPPVAINTKNGSNKVQLVWHGNLRPGEKTGKSNWKLVNFRLDSPHVSDTFGSVTLISYQINGDWIKTIRPKHRTTRNFGY